MLLRSFLRCSGGTKVWCADNMAERAFSRGKRGGVRRLGVTVTSSGRGVLSLLSHIVKVRGSVGLIKGTGGNRRVYRVVGSGRPSIILLSLVVPGVSKLAIVSQVGRSGAIDGRPCFVMVATIKRRGVARSTFGGNTGCCVVGPFRGRVLLRQVQDTKQVPRNVRAEGSRIASRGEKRDLRAQIAGVLRRVKVPTRVGKCRCLESTVVVTMSSVSILGTVAGVLCPAITGGCRAASDEMRHTVQRTVRIT